MDRLNAQLLIIVIRQTVEETKSNNKELTSQEAIAISTLNYLPLFNFPQSILLGTYYRHKSMSQLIYRKSQKH